jgi:acyl-CoA reductase-like NAD-dependent aldehyde dehydrogenase
MTFVREEIFGPVLALCEFDTEDDAVRLANDSVYGLGACVWTSTLKRAHRVSPKSQSGIEWVTGWGDGDQTVAFGGVKGSCNGRDKSLHAL